MSNFIQITSRSSLQGNVRLLPSSKSLSNRALIIQALTENGDRVENLSTARDTQTMKACLSTTNKVIDVKDAGTTMRFLTAYFAVTGQNKVLTGTDRMKERPIRPLVDALRTLGVTLDYLEKEGFPPIETKGFKEQLTHEVAIRGDISSQFISALMMVAPVLPKGLNLRLTGKVASLPYMKMTAGLMGIFGVIPKVGDSTITVLPGRYKPCPYRVEPDWSAASYWFAFTAMAKEADILLQGVEPKALQGDRIIIQLMEPLGVRSSFTKEGLRLTKGPVTKELARIDFSDCPDLAQTILPVCAAKGIRGEFTGLESLRIKETDRIAALQAELAKVGAGLIEKDGYWLLVPGSMTSPHQRIIQTYHDHRMAMGFAPLATLTDITIEDPSVVAKSYPDFWTDMEGLGFLTRLVEQ